MKKNKINRRKFLGLFGTATASAAALLSGCKQKPNAQQLIEDEYKTQVEPPTGKMIYRTNPITGDRVSLLGYGMMRLPTIDGAAGRESRAPLDQEAINQLVDYAIAHGVNYFDTSPSYCQGRSEAATGIALHRHPRESYFIATKMSNFAPATFPHDESVRLFQNSLKNLQVDYIDYYLLHGIGMGGGMEAFNARFIDNGILDYLLEQRKSGKIRNLGFSYHGDIKVFDFLLENNDKYHWDFVQIEMNYLDWRHAHEINERNTNAEYLYGELLKRNIPAVIMEPLLGGRLSNIPQYLVAEMKQRNPERSVASWAFRYCGTKPNVLTALSGMTYMEHLKDNLLSFCPLKPLTEEEENFLYDIARKLVGLRTIPCNDCKYCMPCPYGLDIPGIFVYYNKCKNEGTLPQDTGDKEYAKLRRNYLLGMDRSIPKLRQASHCTGCKQCEPHCPQNIRIPDEMQKIDSQIEALKRELLKY